MSDGIYYKDVIMLTSITREKERVKQLQKYLETCPELLYPDVPSPPLPPTLPPSNHTGEFYDPGYGSLFVKLDCHEIDSKHSQETSDGEDCTLRVIMPERPSLNLYVNLKHSTGDFWVGLGHLPVLQDPEQSVACVKVQFRINDSGKVSQLGIDLMLEVEDAPLVWFSRVA